MSEQSCPLCNLPAKFKLAPYGTSNKCFHCEKCLCFVVTPTVEELIIKVPQSERDRISKISSSLEVGNVLLIWLEDDGTTKRITERIEPESKWY